MSQTVHIELKMHENLHQALSSARKGLLRTLCMPKKNMQILNNYLL